MECHRLFAGRMAYPRKLQRPGTEPPPVLTYRGNPDLLRVPLIGVISSTDTPPDLVLPCLDLMMQLRDAGAAMIGGFQSMLEGHCLAILLRGTQPLVVSPARAIERMQPSAAWEARLRAGSMLVVSRFSGDANRPSVRLALQRNLLVTTVADRLLVMYAGAGSRAIRSATTALEMGKRVYCFDHRRNRDLLLLGAWPLEPSPKRGKIDESVLTLASRAFH